MEKSSSNIKTIKEKAKKQPAKPKPTKKKKSDGATCSMFLAEITKKLILKRRQEEDSPRNVVQNIVDSLTNALPFKITKKPSPPKMQPINIEDMQEIAPELVANDIVDIIPQPVVDNIEIPDAETIALTTTSSKFGFKMPRMPLVNSEVLKVAAIAKRQQIKKEDVATNTGGEHDVASELAKHVNTLRKISLIAEEFNQKTARNLKEIVDSVQIDLIMKLEEIRAEQRAEQEENESQEQ